MFKTNLCFFWISVSQESAV